MDGIERSAFHEQTGFALNELIGPAIVQLVELALLTDVGAWVALTRRGKCVADSVVAEVMKYAAGTSSGP